MQRRQSREWVKFSRHVKQPRESVPRARRAPEIAQMLAEPREARRSVLFGSVPGISPSTAPAPGGDRAPWSMMPMDLRRRRRSKQSVYEMKPWSGRLREYAPYLVISCPSVCLSVNHALSNLRHLVSTLNPCRVDHNSSCASSVADCCFLLAELSGWNRFRSIVNIELRELRPGQLALTCLRRRVVHVPSKIQRRYPFALVHVLLMEDPSIELLELCSSSISQNHLFFRDGVELSGSMRHGLIRYYQLLDYPPRELTDARHSTGTPLYMVEIVSAYFASVGVHMLCAHLVMFEALCTLVFLENWIDVPEAETLPRVGAAHHGLRKIHGDSCYVLAYLVSYSAVTDELAISHHARGTHGKPHGLPALFATVADRCAPLKTYEVCNPELSQVDPWDFYRVLSVRAKLERPTATYIAATADLQFSLTPVISHKATLAKIHVSGCLVPAHNLGNITKAIQGNVTLKKLSFSHVYLNSDATFRITDTLTVNLTQGLLSFGTVKQRGSANFSKQVGDMDQKSRVKFNGFYAVSDSQYAVRDALRGLSRRLRGNAYLSRLAVRMVSVTGCNLAVLLSVFVRCGYLGDAPLALAMETVVALFREIGRSRSFCSLIFVRLPRGDRLK
ncbi:hypothetical protein HPB49_022131 [Dermacentor silvarum]|uniref:Uncharacterized protein n=1 Tax=Dermacentor silvarum TaxID=543639 RepID=A0ACB8E2P3_DERSI|nr:hypothetical protein HPB49_022131 [Dermacentor silvarum]